MPSGKHSLDMIPPVVVYFVEEIVMTELFSVNEAAAIAEVSPETIRTALEKKSVKPSHKRKTGKAVRHQFSVGDVLLVKLLVEFPFPLSRQDKESLAQILARGDTKAFRWGRRRIVSSPEVLGGEPVFRGTRIPVQHVAALFRKGAPEQEIVEDFPSLSERDLAYARLFSRFGEKPGRPRKQLAIHRKRRGSSHAPAPRRAYLAGVGRQIGRGWRISSIRTARRLSWSGGS